MGIRQWPPITPTVGEPLPVGVLESVLKWVKTDRAPGVDDVPIALYNAQPEASGLLRQMVHIITGVLRARYGRNLANIAHWDRGTCRTVQL
eukprot:SAG31_NODE_9222_length_1314_cov_1.150617_2_plen_91_part_00